MKPEEIKTLLEQVVDDKTGNLWAYVLLSAIISLILGFFIEYFKNKGKNLATKEDIAEITETVKTVESQIQIITGNKLEYDNLKRKTLIDYFAAYTAWEREATSLDVAFDEGHSQMNKAAIMRMYKAKHQYNLKEGEVELFIEDTKFYSIRKVLSPETLKFQFEFEKCASEISRIYDTFPQESRMSEVRKVKKEFNDGFIPRLTKLNEHRNAMTKYIGDLLKEMSK